MTKTETINWLDLLKAEITGAADVELELNRFGYNVDEVYHRRVTTLCGGIPKPWLGRWAAKSVAEYAVEHHLQWSDLPERDATNLLKQVPWRIRDEAGDRGTAVHNAIEAHLHGHGLPDDLNEDERLCAEAAQRFLAERDSQILAAEMTVWNSTLDYAGTFDMWDVWQGERWLLDWKTSANVYAEHAIQLAAYMNAKRAIVNKVAITHSGKSEKWEGKVIEWGPHMVDRLGVVHVTPEGCTLYPVRYTDRLWHVFRAAVFTKMFLLDTDDFAGKEPRFQVFDEPIKMNGDE
tara:strand:+ start:5972 stop:6844 length:873 start_codon:yes stop_codon:yes gene_type:complete